MQLKIYTEPLLLAWPEKKKKAPSSKPQAWQPVPEMVGYIRKRYNMETKQLKRIADAIEEILRLVREDMKEMKKAAKWKNSQ